MAKKNRRAVATGAEAVKKDQHSGQSQLMPKLKAVAEAAIGFFSRHRLPCEILAVLFLIAAGFFFRAEDLTDWKKHESQTFFAGQPLHTTFDAYFYLSLAQDLIDGTYHAIDEKRGVPDSPPRPSPPPLISVLAAQITKITHAGLSWVGAILPALLGGMLALPLYLLMRYYSGGLAGFTAALLALMYPFYIYRSGVGRFDTDCMNSTFILMSAYLFLRFALRTDWKRYAYFTLAILNYALFLWWWDQTPAVVTALTFLPCAVALVFYYRPKKKEALFFFCAVAAALLLVLTVKGFGVFNQMLKAIAAQFFYIAKDANTQFPNIGITISEQKRPELADIIKYTTVSVPAFAVACAGLALLVYRRFKDALFLVSIFLLSALAFTYANRFILFLAPLLGIGSGYLLGEAWKLRTKFFPLCIICPVLFLYLAWPLYHESATNAQYPKLTAFTAAGMDAARHKTPENAVIWAWWDNGYALTYFSRRATINDGSIHSGDRTAYSALPLACTDFRLAANFMHFYVIRGIPGIRQFSSHVRMSKNKALDFMKSIFAAGPDEGRILLSKAYWNGTLIPFPNTQEKTGFGWLPFLFPPEKRPVFFFLDSLLARVTYWWYWFGTWNSDTRQGTHPDYQVFSGLQMQGATIAGNGLRIDTRTGEVLIQGKSIQLAKLSIRTEENLTEKKYTTNNTYSFDYNAPGRYGALMDRQMPDTVFHKLFVRNGFNRHYFRPVELRGMTYQLWEAIPDTYTPQDTAATPAVQQGP